MPSQLKAPKKPKQKIWHSTDQSDQDLEAALLAADTTNQTQVIKHALKLGRIKIEKQEITSARLPQTPRIWHPSQASLDDLSACCKLLGTDNMSLVIRYVLHHYVEWLDELYKG